MKTVIQPAQLSWRYLWSRPWSAAVNLLLLTLGLAAITWALLMSAQPDTALAAAAHRLRAFGGVLLVLAAISLFMALWRGVHERRADLALLRMLGAPPGRVAGLVLWEAVWLTALASALGLGLGHGLAHGLGGALQLPITGLVWLPTEAGVPLLAAIVAAVAALLPAMQAYRTDAASVMSQR